MDEEAQADTTDPILERMRRRMKQAIEAEEENRGKEADDMKFLASTPDDNFQWPRDILNQRQQRNQEGGIRPCLTINKMRSHQHQVLNEQKMNRPQITVRPADSKASKEVAKVLNGWLRHIQVASEADLAYDKACEWQTGAGQGYFRMFTQFADEMSFDQDVVFAPCPDRFKVYLDPIGLMQHPAGRKCMWGFIVEDLPKDDYEQEHGDDPVDWNLTGAQDNEVWFPNKNTVRVVEYFEIELRPKTICEWEVPGQAGGAPEKVVTVKDSPEDKRYTSAGYRKTKERKTKIPRCIWRRANGQKVIGKEKEMPTRYVPIVRVVGNEYVIDGELIVDGMVRPAKDAQRMYNFNASAEVEINALQPKSPITAMVEQIKGHEDRYRLANTVGFSYLPYNAVHNEDGSIVSVAAPQRVQPPMPAMAIIQAKIGADNDIKATMGQWGPALGEPSGEKSGKAINARKTESDVGSFHYIDNLARALRYAGTIALDMAPEIIDSRRVVRILGEDDEPDHIVVDPDLPVPFREETGPDGKKVKVYNFALGKYEVVVNTGPSFTTRRAEAAEFLTNAVQSAKDPASANVLAYLAMKNQDWAGADEALSLLKALLPPQAQQALQGEQGGEEEEKIPPQAAAAMDQLKHAAGQMAGQLEAAKQALAERDQALRELKTGADGKHFEALAKMYESDQRAAAEILKSRGAVETARVEAVLAAAKAPEGVDVQGLVANLDAVLQAHDQKLAQLGQSMKTIADQLNSFEIATTMPLGQPAAAAAAPA